VGGVRRRPLELRDGQSAPDAVAEGLDGDR
jgi:hypothetical protein